MLVIEFKYDQFTISFKCEGTWDYSEDTVWFETSALDFNAKRWVYDLMKRTGLMNNLVGVNDPSCAPAFDLVIDGREFKNFQWEALDTHDKLYLKGYYNESGYRLREVGTRGAR